MDGIRTTKVINGTKYTYYYEGGQLRYEQRGNEKLYYAYDGYGYLLSINYTNAAGATTVYQVQTNSRGDVKYIYDTTVALLCEYEYDAWGNILAIKDGNGSLITDENHIAHINPIRYRGYYYDVETGLYYLNSRYYDSEVGRFISADAVISGVGGNVQGYNLYAYCINNPVNMSDPSGNWPRWATSALGAVAAVTAVAVTVVTLGAAAPAAACTLTAVGMSIGASYAVASTAATVAVVATTVVAAAYAGDIAYSAVTGDCLLLDTVLQGNTDAYNTGLAISSFCKTASMLR